MAPVAMALPTGFFEAGVWYLLPEALGRHVSLVLSLVNNVQRGRRFEAMAEAFLVERGWRVLDRNVRFLRKEIDLVVEKDGLVAFVEVKGRSGPAFGHPLEAITWRKRRAISLAARAWIERSDFAAQSYRFDAVSVRIVLGGALELEHVEGAWTE